MDCEIGRDARRGGVKDYLDTQIDPVLCECMEQEHWDVCECDADEGLCDCTVIDGRNKQND
ncbi:MAG: hypothetical protein LBK73_11600 [Treponema sp.]|nr:hypothetical protein [Treponema sp.]